MTSEIPDKFPVVDVPNLSLTLACSDCDVLSSSIAPAQTRDLFIRIDIAQFLDLRSVSAPNVNRVAQSYSQNVLRAPINKIKVKIILKVRSIKNFVRGFVDFTDFSVSGLGCSEKALWRRYKIVEVFPV